MVKKSLGLLVLFVFVLISAAVAEETKPLQLALVDTIQLVPATDSIKGLRLEIYGVNKDVTGLSLGFVHKATGNVQGVEWGLVGISEGDFFGWQDSWILSQTAGRFVGLQGGIVAVTKGRFTGWQAGCVTWTEGLFKGLQTGLVNIANTDAKGVQLGAVNWTEKSFEGVQLGIVNHAGEAHGLQLGLVNYTKSLDGLQIGLANYNGNKKPMEFMVFVNWSF